MRLKEFNDLRDRKAIVRLATPYLKIMMLSYEEFVNYCVKPAAELRQRVRDELYKMDREYVKVNIKVLEEEN